MKCCWELPETQLWHRSIWIQGFGSVPSRLSSPSISTALYQVCTFFTALLVAMARGAKFQSDSFGRLDRNLDFLSLCFVYAPGPYRLLPYHHPKLLPKAGRLEATALSSLSTCITSSSPSLAWIIAAEKRTHGWIPSLARCFQNQGEAERNRWEWPWAEKREVFGRGATNAWCCRSVSSLGKALAEGRAAGRAASLPWKQPKSWLGRLGDVSCLGLLSVDVTYRCRD